MRSFKRKRLGYYAHGQGAYIARSFGDNWSSACAHAAAQERAEPLYRYLARDHGITNVCVLEKGYIGGGNTGRNTTIIRSNYLTPEGVLFYDESVKLYEELAEAFARRLPGQLSDELGRTVKGLVAESGLVADRGWVRRPPT